MYTTNLLFIYINHCYWNGRLWYGCIVELESDKGLSPFGTGFVFLGFARASNTRAGPAKLACRMTKDHCFQHGPTPGSGVAFHLSHSRPSAPGIPAYHRLLFQQLETARGASVMSVLAHYLARHTITTQARPSLLQRESLCFSKVMCSLIRLSKIWLTITTRIGAYGFRA